MPFWYELSGSDNERHYSKDLQHTVRSALAARKRAFRISHTEVPIYHVVAVEIDNHLHVRVVVGQRTAGWDSPDLPSWCRQVREYIDKEASQ